MNAENFHALSNIEKWELFQKVQSRASKHWVALDEIRHFATKQQHQCRGNIDSSNWQFVLNCIAEGVRP